MTDTPHDTHHHHPAIDPKRSLSALQIGVQVFGGLIGVGLLVWALSVVFSDENREQLDRALHAPLHLTLSLVGLSALSVILNGLMFWAVARPIRRLHPLSVIGVNAIATFLSVLPAKLGLAIRGLVHNRRDGMPLRDVIAWLAAMSALGLAALVPIGAVSRWRLEIDIVWFALALGGVALTHAMGVGLGKLAARGTLKGVLAIMSLGSYRIVQHPAPVAAHAVLRVADLGFLAVRFLIASSVLQMALPLDQAILLGAMFFFFGVLAPAGTLGAREAAVAEIGVALGHDRAAVYTAVLFISAIELATSLVMAGIASLWIRPDRLLRAQRKAATEAAAATAG
jgi:hypothetical protein